MLGGSRNETWCGQAIRKHCVSWNLPKLSQLWWCNRGCGPCATQNHLRTKQFMSGTWNSSIVAACALRNEQAGRSHRPRLSSMCEKCLSAALRSQHITRAENCRCLSQEFGAFCALDWGISSTCKVGQKLGVSLPLLTCSRSAWPSHTVPQRLEIPEGLMNYPVYIQAWFGENTFTLWQILYRPGKRTENSARYKKKVGWTPHFSEKTTNWPYIILGGRRRGITTSSEALSKNIQFFILGSIQVCASSFDTTTTNRTNRYLFHYQKVHCRT
jgi:hypothetical protein